MSVYVERIQGVLRGTCLDCAATLSVPDKGIGRANLAAWKTRHQHATPQRPPATAQPDDRSAS